MLLIANIMAGLDEQIGTALNMCDGGHGECGISKDACMITWAMRTISYTLIVCPLVLKMYRTHVIFNASDVTQVNLSDAKLGLCLGALVFLNVVTIALHATNSPFERVSRLQERLKTKEGQISRGNTIYVERWYECESPKDWEYNVIRFMFVGIMLILGSYLAYQTSSIQVPQVNDSDELAWSLYTAFTFGAFITIVDHLDGLDYRLQYAINAYLTNFAVVFVMYMLFRKSLGAICIAGDSDKELKYIMDTLHASSSNPFRSDPFRSNQSTAGSEASSQASAVDTQTEAIAVVGSFGEDAVFDPAEFDDADDVDAGGSARRTIDAPRAATLRSMHSTAVLIEVAPSPNTILNSDIPRISLAVPLDGTHRSMPLFLNSTGSSRGKSHPHRTNTAPDMRNMFSHAVPMHDVGDHDTAELPIDDMENAVEMVTRTEAALSEAIANEGNVILG